MESSKYTKHEDGQQKTYYDLVGLTPQQYTAILKGLELEAEQKRLTSNAASLLLRKLEQFDGGLL